MAAPTLMSQPRNFYQIKIQGKKLKTKPQRQKYGLDLLQSVTNQRNNLFYHSSRNKKGHKHMAENDIIFQSQERIQQEQKPTYFNETLCERVIEIHKQFFENLSNNIYLRKDIILNTDLCHNNYQLYIDEFNRTSLKTLELIAKFRHRKSIIYDIDNAVHYLLNLHKLLFTTEETVLKNKLIYLCAIIGKYLKNKKAKKFVEKYEEPINI